MVARQILGVLAGASAAICSSSVVVLDPTTATVRFDGIGGDSGGGGGSRLLLDYDEPFRSDILDLLFKPKWGASLHTIKVELGCDGDSTQGAEQSHMHTADDHSPTAFNRGYEVWLLQEARRRNPTIHTSGLEWGVPGWVNEGGYFGDKNTQYMLAWMLGLKERKNLTLDSISLGRNEDGYDVAWIKKTRQAMNVAGFSSVKVVAADDHRGGTPALIEEMVNDTELRDAIDFIGVHTMGRLNGVVVPEESKAQMAAMHKPFWNTEQHFGTHAGEGPDSCREWATAAELALTLNRLYVQENMTSILMWTPIYSWYAWLWFSGKGLMVANTPWDSHYEISATVWVAAMTTQFAQPGDRYMASGMLCAADTCGPASSCNCTGQRCGGQVPCGSGSYVSYLSSDGRHATIVIETMWKNGSVAGVLGPYDNQDLQFQLSGPLRSTVKAMHLWSTNRTHQMIQMLDVPVSPGGIVSITVPKNTVFTLSSTTGQRKARGAHGIPPAKDFSTFLPLRYNFEGAAIDSLPRFWSDMHGAFAVAKQNGTADGVGSNQVMRQNAPVSPTLHSGMTFATAIGDNSWSGYNISMRARTMHEGGELYLTSHAGVAHHGQIHQAGMEPGDICGGFGYRLSISCSHKRSPSAQMPSLMSCPANKSNVQCGGLKNDKAADGSAELCAAACCADTAANCQEWYWRPVLDKSKSSNGSSNFDGTRSARHHAVAGGCWRGRCVVPPTPSAGWIGGTRGGRADSTWTLSAKTESQYAILASGSDSDVGCVTGEFINMSVAVLAQPGSTGSGVGTSLEKTRAHTQNLSSVTDSLIVIAMVGGKELARVAAPTWGFTSGAASVGCSVGIAEFDDIVIEQNAHQP